MTGSCVPHRWSGQRTGGRRYGLIISMTSRDGSRKREAPADMIPGGVTTKQACWKNCAMRTRPAFLTGSVIPMTPWETGRWPPKSGGGSRRRAAFTGISMTGCRDWQAWRRTESRCAVTSMMPLETGQNWRIMPAGQGAHTDMMPWTACRSRRYGREKTLSYIKHILMIREETWQGNTRTADCCTDMPMTAWTACRRRGTARARKPNISIMHWVREPGGAQAAGWKSTCWIWQSRTTICWNSAGGNTDRPFTGT